MANSIKPRKKDIWEGLADVFDMDDFACLVRDASPSTRLNAYLQIIKLLTYRSKTTGTDIGGSEVDRMIDEMFKPKKNE